MLEGTSVTSLRPPVPRKMFQPEAGESTHRFQAGKRSSAFKERKRNAVVEEGRDEADANGLV